MASVKITLEKSLIGRLDKQIKTANSLGLKKIGDTTTQADSPALQGKIFVIKHLVKVENVD
ncbi:MAG: 50S ribosomal protein L30 [Clostridia bacterium]|nr:50S ribosomal protein L30 [Clostridia bacterium]